MGVEEEQVKTMKAYFKNKVTPRRVEIEQKKQTVMPVLENIMNHVTAKDPRFCNTADMTGPYYQGNFLWTKSSDEFDYHVNLSVYEELDWVPTRPRFYNLDQSWMHMLEDLDNILRNIVTATVPLPKAPAGHSICTVPSLSDKFGDMMYQADIIPFFVRRKFKEHLIDAVRSLGYRGDIKLARKRDGTVLTLRIPCATHGEVSVHMIPIIPMRIRFPDHIDWPRKEAEWPSQEKIARVKKIGINEAATTPFYWSYMFEECEKELLVDIDADGGSRKKAFRILECLTSEFQKVNGREVQLLTAKHIKNLFLWECEKYPSPDDWSDSMLPTRVRGMVTALRDQLKTEKMSQYWNPEVNLLDSSLIVDKPFITDVLKNVSAYCLRPESFLK